MDEKRCENCKYFHQHYVKISKRFAVSGWGHSTLNRIKPRKVDGKICLKFDSNKKRNTLSC